MKCASKTTWDLEILWQENESSFILSSFLWNAGEKEKVSNQEGFWEAEEAVSVGMCCWGSTEVL